MAMYIWNLKLMQQEISPMNSIWNVSFTQSTEHPYSLNTSTVHVSRVTVLGTDIVPENVE